MTSPATARPPSQTPLPSAFSVNIAALTLPFGTKAGDPVWVDGFLTRFGSAPPDLAADAVNNELSVQTAGGQEGGAASTAPGVETCGVGSQICNPASLQVVWTSPPGTSAPFDTVSSSGFTINLAQAEYLTGVIRIGPESIDLKSVPAGDGGADHVAGHQYLFAPVRIRQSRASALRASRPA